LIDVGQGLIEMGRFLNGAPVLIILLIIAGLELACNRSAGDND
jgi:hypothetical protein